MRFLIKLNKEEYDQIKKAANGQNIRDYISQQAVYNAYKDEEFQKIGKDESYNKMAKGIRIYSDLLFDVMEFLNGIATTPVNDVVDHGEEYATKIKGMIKEYSALRNEAEERFRIEKECKKLAGIEDVDNGHSL